MLCHKENLHKKMVKKLDISNKMLASKQASKQASKYILINYNDRVADPNA